MCETEHSGRRHAQERYRGMCSDPVDPGGEVLSSSVGCTKGMWDIAPLVWIIATGRYIGFLELKKCFFMQGRCGCGVRRDFLVF